MPFLFYYYCKNFPQLTLSVKWDHADLQGAWWQKKKVSYTRSFDRICISVLLIISALSTLSFWDPPSPMLLTLAFCCFIKLFFSSLLRHFQKMQLKTNIKQLLNTTLNPTIFNIIRWVAGTIVSLTKRMICEVLFFFIISCKILCKNPFNLSHHAKTGYCLV